MAVEFFRAGWGCREGVDAAEVVAGSVQESDKKPGPNRVLFGARTRPGERGWNRGCTRRMGSFRRGARWGEPRRREDAKGDAKEEKRCQPRWAGWTRRLGSFCKCWCVVRGGRRASVACFEVAHSGTLWHIGLPRFTGDGVKGEDVEREGRAEGARLGMGTAFMVRASFR